MEEAGEEMTEKEETQAQNPDQALEAKEAVVTKDVIGEKRANLRKTLETKEDKVLVLTERLVALTEMVPENDQATVNLQREVVTQQKKIRPLMIRREEKKRTNKSDDD
jgi:predicted nucleic acid-binding protein